MPIPDLSSSFESARRSIEGQPTGVLDLDEAFSVVDNFIKEKRRRDEANRKFGQVERALELNALAKGFKSIRGKTGTIEGFEPQAVYSPAVQKEFGVESLPQKDQQIAIQAALRERSTIKAKLDLARTEAERATKATAETESFGVFGGPTFSGVETEAGRAAGTQAAGFDPAKYANYSSFLATFQRDPATIASLREIGIDPNLFLREIRKYFEERERRTRIAGEFRLDVRRREQTEIRRRAALKAAIAGLGLSALDLRRIRPHD